MRTHWIRRNLIYIWYMRIKALVAALRYWFPTREINIITVTWTDGKSTTCALTYHILKSAGTKVWILSTVYLDTWAGLEDNTTKLTSISHGAFQRLVRQSVNAWYTHLVVEASSHALYQSRIWPTKAIAAGFTNLSREHLDFHWTMEHYAATKWKIFKEYLQPWGLCVLPHCFEYDRQVLPTDATKRIIRFGYDDRAQIYATDIKSEPFLEWVLHAPWATLPVSTSMVWAFNIENAMVAIMLAREVWVSWEACKEWVESFGGLPWRQQLVRRSKEFWWPDGAPTVMIDFALTPDALKTLYSAADKLWFNKLIAVFGATWERDQGKRPLMGEIAITHCDHVVLTDDEPYSEDGMKIIEQIQNWIVAVPRNEHRWTYEIVPEREEAIHKAIADAWPNDLVIITWMANFTTRWTNQGSVPWNEEEVVKEGLANYI